MGKKYDTNPLDPDFPRKAGHSQHTDALFEQAGQTTEFPPPSVTEEQTRRFSEPEVAAYQPPSESLDPPTHAPLAHSGDRAPSRRVPGLVFSERTLTAMVYFPFTLGFIAGFIVLLLAPRKEAKLRFHAAQAFAAHIAIFAITGFLGIVRQNFAASLFGAVTTIMLLIFVHKAWKNRPIHIEALEPLTEWCEEKLSKETKWG